MQQVTTVGLDIAKRLFQMHGVDGEGKVVMRRRLTRHQVSRRRSSQAFIERSTPGRTVSN